jgi:predicted pyridoxine 5'-phosphate oxidase superfamily flavin-nucleotide-binding protein
MIELTDEMKELLDSSLADRMPVMVATASKAGVPDISFKGSAMVWDREHLAFWERYHGETERNLVENPHVTLYYRNPDKRIGWRFFGTAELLTEGELREQIMARVNEIELSRDPERKGTAVLIRVDRVMQGVNVLMQRD